MSLHTGLDEIRTADPPNFSVGGILWRSIVLTLWNFFMFVGFALVISVPVGVAMWLIVRSGAVDPWIEIEDFQIVSRSDQMLAFLAFTFVGLLAYLMVQSAVVYRAFRSLGRAHAGFGACLARSLAVVLHLGEFAVVASILLGAALYLIYSETSWLLAQDQIGVAIFFGILLLGVLLFIVAGCWVVFPAIVIERIGPVAAILRSWRLTRGHRWGILVLLALFALVEWAISSMFHIEIEIVITLSGPINMVILNVPLAFLGAVVVSTSYYNLVGEKDGVTALGRIFA